MKGMGAEAASRCWVPKCLLMEQVTRKELAGAPFKAKVLKKNQTKQKEERGWGEKSCAWSRSCAHPAAVS